MKKNSTSSPLNRSLVFSSGRFVFMLALMSILLSPLRAQNGIAVPQMSNCDNLVTQFLNQYDIPGATFALAKNGKLVYMRSFGDADLAGQEETQPYHMFRIASVSKPITGIAIMKLVENGQLSLSDKAFGSTGRLASHPYLSTVTYSDARLNDVTVQQLLEHTGGWNRNIDCVPSPNPPYTWAINHCDPIGFPLYVTQALGETNPVREEVLIRFLMEKGLAFTPGTQYAYSNIGYLVLGEIIAVVSGKSYEDYVKDEILSPLGIYDMHLGKNLLADKREREGEYQGNGFIVPSSWHRAKCALGIRRLEPRSDGRSRRMDRQSAGPGAPARRSGWIQHQTRHPVRRFDQHHDHGFGQQCQLCQRLVCQQCQPLVAHRRARWHGQLLGAHQHGLYLGAHYQQARRQCKCECFLECL